jgi:uncharacterized protein YecE (DUF72 family)
MAGCATGEPIATAAFVYVRFHGPARYSGRYPDQVLDGWAAWMAAQRRAGRDVFAYFNNDAGGDAPRDAMRLREALQSYVQSGRGGTRERNPADRLHGASTVAR